MTALPFHPATAAWFADRFGDPTRVQSEGWARIAAGEHALLVAPTGSGKTLAAFLSAIDRLAHEPQERPGTRVVYLSPLKALAVDVERNLRAPLAGVLRTAERRGERARNLRVDVRTGDTPQSERRRQRREPGEILVTTPESLYLMLGSQAREGLRSVETVIVDEIHALAPTKRGVHLALSLERLAELAGEFQRVGLSATVRPLNAVADFLGGVGREVAIVDAGEQPRIDLAIRVPAADMERPPAPKQERREGGAPREATPKDRGRLAVTGLGTHDHPGQERGLWPSIWPELVEAIRAHRSTILFVNSRSASERLVQRVNELAGEELALAHHGSVSHERRAEIEEGLKAGRLRAIVATSSLELGIDMGAVDQVLLIESPGSVARGLQRVGRAGHDVGAVSRGRIFPKFKGDLLECAVVARRMIEGAIEAIETPQNALDVLAQQLVAICCERPRSVSDLGTLVRRAHPYRELSTRALTATLDMLSGRYAPSDIADLRPRLAWDRARDVLEARRGTQLVSRLNAGTIPDRGAFAVTLGHDGPRVGELDEEMVFESRPGDTFLLGASTWRVEEITKDRVIASPAPGEPGRLPFWKGEGPGRPVELGRALGAFCREAEAVPPGELTAWLQRAAPLDELAAANLTAYLTEQREATGALPTDRRIVVERFRDELGDWRVCILSPFGRRVHAPLALAIEERLSARNGVDASVMESDDGIVLRLADTDEPPALDDLLPDPEEVVELVTERLGRTALFASLFRENAVRALLVTRRRPDQRNPLWAQRRKSRALLATVQRHPDFPIVLETYRQALRDHFDLPGLEQLLGDVRARRVRVEAALTDRPSPFARSLVFAYVANYIYDGDTPAAERRAQALTLDERLLAELLGQAELRTLLDADALAELEAELAGLDPERLAPDRHELHDRLRALGDLTSAECAERCAGDAGAWLAKLEAEHRAARVTIAGDARWIAAEHVGLYRDALGCRSPAGLPADFLDPVPDALLALLARFAARRGPFVTEIAAERFGLVPAQVEPALRALESEGRLVRGELRPGGVLPEWCDAQVLRRLKRRTLAKLRDQVAPADAAALGRFLPAWHAIGGRPPGGDPLERALETLEGLALPWSALAGELLPARVPNFRADALDLAAATGRIVWVGRGAVGPRDGKVAIYRRDRAAELLEPPDESEPASAVHAALLATLKARGACFLTELERAARAAGPQLTAREIEAALWDLVWDGRVTNDTFAPLRALRAPRHRGRSGHTSQIAGGRWSLVRELIDPQQDDTRRTLARAHSLLERYGVVSREAAVAEGFAFGPLYRVLRAMEESGRVQRGWFVDGLSGAQFARPGAVDRLRDAREEEGGAADDEVLVLSAVDPANPWGALLPWTARADEDAPPPRRVAGAQVGLVHGAPTWWLSASRKHLAVFPTDLSPAALERALRALHDVPRRGRGLLSIERIDGVPAEDSPHAARLEAAGFARDYRGYLADPK